MTKFNFIKNRKIYYTISIILVLVAIVFSFLFGVQLDIQFKGGTIITYTHKDSINIDEATKFIEETIDEEVKVTESKSIASGEKNLVITLSSSKGLSSEKQEKLSSALIEKYKANSLELFTVNSVNPVMGQEFFFKSIVAVILASTLIIIFVALRFRKIGGWSAGVMGIVALFHDVFMVYATFILFKIPIDDNFIAVVLTILGFSINDTIVIYDRIRENKKIYGSKMSIADLTNLSINQSLTRSVNTALAVIITLTVVCVVALYYNVDAILSFSFPMVIGMISGCYSTICIAGPLWVSWQEYKAKKQKAAVRKA